MQGDSSSTALSSNLPRASTSQPTRPTVDSLSTDLASLRYHVVENPHDSDCESTFVRSSPHRCAPVSRTDHDGDNLRRASQHAAETRCRRHSSRYRRRRNRIGLMLIFAAILLFAGLFICANTKEYIAGAAISVIGVVLCSSSMVLCLLMTDSCGRVHGFRERSWSRSRASYHANADTSTGCRPTHSHYGDVASANVSFDVQQTSVTLPPTARCNISGDFLDHLPPPLYETSEILRHDHSAINIRIDEPGAAGGSSDYQYYKVRQGEHDGTMPMPSAVADTSHLCEECVQRQQNLDSSGLVHEEQLLLAPAVIIELPSYDEAIAEDS